MTFPAMKMKLMNLDDLQGRNIALPYFFSGCLAGNLIVLPA